MSESGGPRPWRPNSSHTASGRAVAVQVPFVRWMAGQALKPARLQRCLPGLTDIAEAGVDWFEDPSIR
jgi:hypothetical protein